MESRDLIINKKIFQAVNIGKTYLLVIKSSQKMEIKESMLSKEALSEIMRGFKE